MGCPTYDILPCARGQSDVRWCRLLEPLDKTPRYKEIQEQISDYIVQENLKPGDRLPAEPEIAARLGVSRNAVREAIRALEAKGIIKVRHGLGTYVKEFNLADLLTDFAYGLLIDGQAAKELYEIRKHLELSYIKAAVRKITDEDIEEMRSILEEMRAKAVQGERFPEEDLALHRVIFHNVDNKSLLKLLDVFRSLYKSEIASWNRSKKELLINLKDHITLVEAIAARDEEEAWIRLDKQFLDWTVITPDDRASQEAIKAKVGAALARD